MLNDPVVLLGFDNRRTVTDIYRINDILEQIENTGKEISNSVASLAPTDFYDKEHKAFAHIQRDIADLSAICKYLKRIITGILI